MVEKGIEVDKLIEKLVGEKGKDIKLNETEIRGVCNTAR